MPQWLNFSDILNVSITASWLVLAVLVLRLLLKKAPKWTHVALWGLVAVRLLLPFSIESVFSLIPSAETVPSEILSYEGEQLTQPGRLDIVTNPAYTGDISIELPQAVDRVQQRTVDMTVIWLAGAAVMGLYAILSYWHLRRKVRTAVRTETGIYQSEAVPSPFVLGIIRPKIYLPFAMTASDMLHVIAHERAHIRRKDHWWKPLGFVLLSIHWFNPIMWLAYILLCRDIELACDEKVIKELGTEQRADYSQALLSCSVRRHTIAACPLAFGEVGVKERVSSVLNYKKPAFWIIIAAVITCIAAAVCFLTDPIQKADHGRLAVGDYIPVRDIYSSPLNTADDWTNYRYTVGEDHFRSEYIPGHNNELYKTDWGWQTIAETEDDLEFLRETEFYAETLDEHSLYQNLAHYLHIIKADDKLYLINGSNDGADHEKLLYIRQIVPENQYTSTFPTDGTAQLTLADVLSMSKKGNSLAWEDLAPYKCTDIGSGIFVFRYEIDDRFSLEVSAIYPEEGIDAAVLRHINGNWIDIRTDDVQIFIRDMEPVDFLYYWIKNDTMSFPDRSYQPRQGTVLHGSSSEGLSQRFQAIEDSEHPLPTQNMISLRFADEAPLKITWKTFDPYNTSTSGSIDNPTRISTIVLGANKGLPLASDLENIPPRRVQILCTYKNRTVEYLLIISST